jgi:phosphoribosylamine--glycine ligase/phosphoribosylformylglycinamidine cyclo-ligase
MNVLVVGSGGREHTLAWKISQSSLLSELYALPGNPGTAQVAQNLPVSADDTNAIVEAAIEKEIELVVVGPEVPLANGITDALMAKGIRVFGPTAAAAQLESSKAFAKTFMQRHGIPTAGFEVFEEYEKAIDHVRGRGMDYVIKASGLAAGKGVILPADPEEAQQALREIMVDERFGDAGDRVVIEDKLAGREVSLLAFSDGRDILPMPTAQDHKRLLDNDRGPNTGGMGTFSPSPSMTAAEIEDACRRMLQPVIDGMREEGNPFVGVLYGGLILTESGVQVLEYNCRFGDPETQVILPLLESDLLEIMLACVEGNLAQTAPSVRWSDGAALCVVLASGGYPGTYKKGIEITGLDSLPDDVWAFHAGTTQKNGAIVTNGGRVLGVTARGPDIDEARKIVYAGIEKIRFEGMQYRNDIAKPASAYAAAGVDIDAGNRAVTLMKKAVESTHGAEVLAGVGAFGGLFQATRVSRMRDPVLSGSTDSVGTKVMLGVQLGRYHDLGVDLVNHCINDILVQGARPLFFLDYIGCSATDPDVVAELVAGVADACREADCALLGGETAELPGMYVEGQLDLAGAVVGVVEREAILPGDDIQAGDVLLGLASSGPHTNGFSLIRRVFAGEDLPAYRMADGSSLADALLAPHRSYLPYLSNLLDLPERPLKALVHITGGGFFDNIPRALPENLGARVDSGAWTVPQVFQLIQDRGRIEREEMYRVFNMGIGMIAVVDPADVKLVRETIAEDTYVIGEVCAGNDVVLV